MAWRAVPRHRNDAIELLRALAALAVALVHLTFGFARYVDNRIPVFPLGDRVAEAAVAAFFVISGAAMVLSAGPLSPRPVGASEFWRRRAIRVLPPYWAATALFVAVSLSLGLAIDPAAVLRSLAFAPPGTHAPVPFLPFLWPGWTLAFELVFYALFGACLLAGQTRAVALCGAILLASVAAGTLLHPASYFLRLLTAPHLLLFAVGLALGTALARGCRAPRAVRALAGALSFAALLLAPASWGWLGTAGIAGSCAFVAVATGPIPRRLHRVALAGGGASYALYLLHIPFAHAWMQVFNIWMRHPAGSIGYIGFGVPLLLALALAFHRAVERPAIDRLIRWAGVARRS